VQRFGAHVSIAGGLHQALLRAHQIGCDCLQIFVKNQRQWHAPPLHDEQVRLWKRAWRRLPLRPVIAHGAYLINLASPDPRLWAASIDAGREELRRCAILGIRDWVIHPGSHAGAGIGPGIVRVSDALQRLLDDPTTLRVRILLETTAGQGAALGSSFEHLADIIARLARSRRLGVCLDTAHLFAAGYDLASPDGYAATIQQLARLVGLRRVRCLHCNDSKAACGRRVDRHEHIGRGTIGPRAFRRLLNDPRLANVPRILETPKGTDPRGRNYDRINLARLRRLVAD
jgi:deoxyribonuclease-4